MSLYARLAAGLLILLVAAGLWWKADRVLAAREQRGYDRRATEDAAVEQAQAARNRDLQRAAELRYTVAAAPRERVIVQTITEVRHATAALAACPVPPAARQLLNDAAGCARQDRPASCGPGEPVPGAQ